MTERLDAIAQLPKRWQGEVRRELDPAETLLAWFEPDLDTQLRFSPGLLLVTDRRVLTTQKQQAAGAEGEPPHWHSWPLDSVTTLGAGPQAGVGTLELLSTGERLAHWHYTLGRSSTAERLVQQFADFRRTALAGRDDGKLHGEQTKTCCPDCGAELPAESIDCPFCTPGKTEKPARSLLRLARFARPHARTVAIGFVLTLAGTAAGQVPPYLVMPLVDNVLAPYGRGESVSFDMVKWYVGGLFLAAVFAWAFNWARTYVLAWVFERISAGLRNHTYAHLQRLSLEYFGGQRTGDLMARVSTDTERICDFLSLNLLDFGTNVLMMLMTAAILVRINPWLALVTLVPFPVIAWMILRVRDRLRKGFLEAGRV
ncbi:MAG TPA: ABC transporter transmembrane domain-containing protein, partial [Pirellulales bacterium]|nr:ABC transporter transmembrane domain-containing protein [Pirellulales bacterium]